MNYLVSTTITLALSLKAKKKKKNTKEESSYQTAKYIICILQTNKKKIKFLHKPPKLVYITPKRMKHQILKKE